MLRFTKTTLRILGTASFLAILLASLTACQTWRWLWSQDMGIIPNPEDLILGGEPEEESGADFEGAVVYDGSAHSGTDIYYRGKAGHKNADRIIVIDAGHQAAANTELEPNGPASEVLKMKVTAGATGVSTGLEEYKLNLKVALRLRDELIRRGYSVVMIRETNNVNIANSDRAGIANKYNAAAYIRIHANSWDDNSMKGAMTVCQSSNNPYPDCVAHYKESRLLSELILEEFCEQTGMTKTTNPLREMDNMTGTNWSRVPTTIVEMGFLSNPSDDEIMASNYFAPEAAIGIANGLDAYFSVISYWAPETEAPTDEVPAPATDAPTEASTDPITDAPDETVTDPVIESTTDVVTDPVTEPITDPTDDPNVAPDEEPTDEPTDGPDTPTAPTPIFENPTPYTGEAHPGVGICYEGKEESPNRERIIVIDAGHQLQGSSVLEPNGPDSEDMKAQVSWGSTGAFTGQTEYELNLAVALHLRDELIARGYSVVMIRETNEVNISNMERAIMANSFNAAAFIRIHGNGWADDPTRNGALAICQSVNNPYPSCAAHYAQSRFLSETVLEQFCAETGMAQSVNPLREMDNQTGVNWSEVPTTTMEMGFLSNEADDRLMLTDEFRKNAAVGMANGLDAFFAAYES